MPEDLSCKENREFELVFVRSDQDKFRGDIDVVYVFAKVDLSANRLMIARSIVCLPLFDIKRISRVTRFKG